MSAKRVVKQLMAAGIQRNDAKNFVKTYHTIKAAKMCHLFPELRVPEVPQIEKREVYSQTFRCEMAIDRREYDSCAIGVDRYARDRLKGDMARRIVEAEAVKFTRRQDLCFVTYRAELRVLMPEGVAE